MTRGSRSAAGSRPDAGEASRIAPGFSPPRPSTPPPSLTPLAPLERLERGFLWLAAGLGLTAWLALLLAELGRLSAWPLMAALLATAGAGLAAAGARRALTRRRGSDDGGATAGPAGPAGVDASGRWQVLGLALVVIAGAALFFPAYETVVWAGDSTVYLNFADRIRESGGLVFEDPLLQQLPVDQRAALFRNSTPLDTTGEYVRFPGGFLIPDVAEDEVTAAFSPLFPILLAVSSLLTGIDGRLVVAPLFALLAVCATFLIARRLGDSRAGFLAAAVLTVSLPQIWFARVGLPETVAQLFLLAGILALLVSRESDAPVLPALAGSLIGLATLARVDLVVLAGVALVVFAGAVLALRGRWSRPLAWSMAGFALPATHLLIHYSVFPSHYSGYVSGRIRGSALASLWAAATNRGWSTAEVAALAATLLAAAAIALLVKARKRNPEKSRKRPRLAGWALLATGLAYFANYYASTGFKGLDTARALGASLSWPLLALALVGVAVLWTDRDLDWRAGLLPTLAAVVCLHYLWDPHTVQAELWRLRRFVPVVVPAVAVLGAVGAIRLVDRLSALLTDRPEARPTSESTASGSRPAAIRRWATAVSAVVLVALAGRPGVALVGDTPWGGQEAWLQALADRFPGDSLLLAGPDLAGTHVATSLGYLHEIDAVLIQEPHPETDAVRTLVRDALGRGRDVYFVLGDEEFGLYAPRLSLGLHHETELVLTVLEQAPSGALRRASDRVMPIRVLQARLRPSDRRTSVDVGDPLEDMLFRPRGFHAPEEDTRDDGSFRWTGIGATLTLPPAEQITLVLDGTRPPRAPAPRISIELDGEALVQELELPPGLTRLSLTGPGAQPAGSRPDSADPVKLTLRSNTFRPGDLGTSSDERRLGVKLYRLELTDRGTGPGSAFEEEDGERKLFAIWDFELSAG